MKKLAIMFVTLMFLATSGIAKETNINTLETLNIDLANYQDAVKSMNVPKMMNYVYPGMFKIFPKETMEQAMQTMYKSGLMPKILKMFIQKIDPIKTFDDGFYTTVSYGSSMQMSVPEFNPENKDQIIAALKLKLGKNTKVLFDDKTDTFIIDKTSKMIAIKEGAAAWKFLEEDKASLLKDKIFPKSLLEKLK